MPNKVLFDVVVTERVTTTYRVHAMNGADAADSVVDAIHDGTRDTLAYATHTQDGADELDVAEGVCVAPVNTGRS